MKTIGKEIKFKTTLNKVDGWLVYFKTGKKMYIPGATRAIAFSIISSNDNKEDVEWCRPYQKGTKYNTVLV